jgi:hypothetical protein
MPGILIAAIRITLVVWKSWQKSINPEWGIHWYRKPLDIYLKNVLLWSMSVGWKPSCHRKDRKALSVTGRAFYLH